MLRCGKHRHWCQTDPLTACASWANHLTSLSLSLLIYKMGIAIDSSQHFIRIKQLKYINKCLEHSRYLIKSSKVCDCSGGWNGAWKQLCSKSTKQKERPGWDQSMAIEGFGSDPHHNFSPTCLRVWEEEWTSSPLHFYPNKNKKTEE